MRKSLKTIQPAGREPTPDELGRSYYLFCLEVAAESVRQARTLVAGDVTDENHELPEIERLLSEALVVA